MTALDQRSTAELRRLRDRATNETIRELLNAELEKRWRAKTNPIHALNARGNAVSFLPNPGQP